MAICINCGHSFFRWLRKNCPECGKPYNERVRPSVRITPKPPAAPRSLDDPPPTPRFASDLDELAAARRRRHDAANAKAREEERRRDDDAGGFDGAGFAIGLATGMPISPAHGVSGGALLGSMMSDANKPKDTGASEPASYGASHSAPAPTPSYDSGSKGGSDKGGGSDYSSSSDSGGGGGGDGGGGGGGGD